jgi:hypothetical protein
MSNGDSKPSPFHDRTYVGRDGLRRTRSVRQFLAEAERWTVYEETDATPRGSGPSLVFEADRIARRVRNYPANWRELTDEQLYVLSLSR